MTKEEKRAHLAKLAHELSDAIHAYNMSRPANEPDETTYVHIAHAIADHFTNDDLWAEENPFHPESPEGRAWEISNG